MHPAQQLMQAIDNLQPEASPDKPEEPDLTRDRWRQAGQLVDAYLKTASSERPGDYVPIPCLNSWPTDKGLCLGIQWLIAAPNPFQDLDGEFVRRAVTIDIVLPNGQGNAVCIAQPLHMREFRDAQALAAAMTFGRHHLKALESPPCAPSA